MSLIKHPWIGRIRCLGLGYNLAGIAIPLIVSILLSLALKLGFSLETITNGGQFALYSMAMLVSTHYLLTKRSTTQIRFLSGFGIIFLVLFALSLIFFCIAVLALNGQQIEKQIVQWPTVGLFFVSVIITFIAVILTKT